MRIIAHHLAHLVHFGFKLADFDDPVESPIRFSLNGLWISHPVAHDQRFRGLFAQNLACRLQPRQIQVIIFTDPAQAALVLGLAQIPTAQAMQGAVAYINTY